MIAEDGWKMPRHFRAAAILHEYWNIQIWRGFVMERLVKATDTFKELMFWYFGVVVMGALLFSFFEQRSFDESLWWAFVTALTVGYGDVVPATPGGRIVAVLLMHSVIFVVAPIIIGRLLNRITVDANQFTHEEQEQIKRDLAEIKEMLARRADSASARSS